MIRGSSAVFRSTGAFSFCFGPAGNIEGTNDKVFREESLAFFDTLAGIELVDFDYSYPLPMLKIM